MAYASLQGRAIPSRGAAAVCDRCGFVFNHVDLKFQHEWRGPVVQNIQLLVCRYCMDTPNENLRTIALPPDPLPILNARVQDFESAENDYRALTPSTVTDFVTGLPRPAATLRVTQDCNNRTTTAYGDPLGLDQNAIMPQQTVNGVPIKYGVPLPVLSVSAFGTIVTVTCYAVHNLQPGDQISVEGLTGGNGFYSVEVPTATVFKYQLVNGTTTSTASSRVADSGAMAVTDSSGSAVTASPLRGPQPVPPELIPIAMTSAVRIVTANVGLPLGATELRTGY